MRGIHETLNHGMASAHAVGRTNGNTFYGRTIYLKGELNMIAIMTKYLPATAKRPARVKAYTCMGAHLTIAYDDSLNSVSAFAKAAVALARRMGWAYSGNLISGGIKDGYVFVFTNSATFDI